MRAQGKFLLFLIAFCVVPAFSYGQCYFFRLFDNQQDDDFGRRIIRTQDSDFVVAGRTDTPSPYDSNWFLKVNACGDSLWAKQYTMTQGGGESPQAIFQLQDSSFAIFGNQYDPTEGSASSYLLKFSKDGDSLWHKIVNVGYNDWCQAALTTSDGGFIGAGTYNRPFPNGQAFLVKTDSLGNIEWQYNYGDTNQKPWVEHMERTLDGYYLLSGYMLRQGQNENLFLMKIDTLGGLQWLKSYGGANLTSLGWGISTVDSGYMTVGYKETAPSVYQGYIVKTNSVGVVVWEKNYGDTLLDMPFAQVAQTNDGNCIVAGNLQYPVGGLPDGYPIYLMKIDPNGNILWKRNISYYSKQDGVYTEDLKILANGDLLMTGFVIPDNNHFSGIRNQLFILKTDSCGFSEFDTASANFFADITGHTASFTNQSQQYCSLQWYFGDGDSSITVNPSHTYADTGYYTITLICRAGNDTDTFSRTIWIGHTTGLDSPQENKALVYPNPANTTLMIDIPDMPQSELLLFDGLGRLVKRELLQRGLNVISTEDLLPGLYAYKIGGSAGTVSVVH